MQRKRKSGDFRYEDIDFPPRAITRENDTKIH